MLSIKIRTRKSFTFIIWLLFFTISAAAINIPPKHETDSISKLIAIAKTDSGKFDIVNHHIWSNYNWGFIWYHINRYVYFNNVEKEIVKSTTNKRILAEYFRTKGNIEMWQAKYDSAKVSLTLALNFAYSCGNNALLANCYYNLFELNRCLINNELAIKYAKHSANYSHKAQMHKMEVEAYRLICELFDQMGQIDSALVFMQKRNNTSKINNDVGNLLASYLSLSYFYKLNNNLNKSIIELNKAIALKDSILRCNGSMSDLNNADIFFEVKKDYSTSLKLYQKSLLFYISQNDYYKTAMVYSSLGHNYMMLNRMPESLYGFRQALAMAQKYDFKEELVDAYFGLGQYYKKKGDFEQAKYYFKISYEVPVFYRSKISKHPTLIELSELCLKTKKPDSAIFYANSAIELAQLYQNPECIVKSHFMMSLLFQNNNKQLVLEHYNKAYKTVNNTVYLSLIAQCADSLYSYFKINGNYSEALQYLLIARKMSDSSLLLNNKYNILEHELSFETEKLKKENEQKFNEASKQATVKKFLLLIIVFTSILGLVLYLGYRKVKKQNLLLLEQKKEIELISANLHKADEQKLLFFTNISHEFRTPLTLIIGPLEKLICDYESDQILKHELDLIQRNSFQLLHLINRLLDIRKLDSGQIKLKVTKSNLAHYLKAIFSSFSNLAEENEINFNFNYEGENNSGWFDADIITKICNNLLSNAFNHTPKKGAIYLQLSISNNSEFANIKVSDTGKGISERNQKYIFDRYYQVETTSTNINTGTGLGLAFTNDLVCLHKGNIDVESIINIGTTFSVSIPIKSNYYTEDEIAHFDQEYNETYQNLPYNTYLQQFKAPELNELVNEKISESETSPVILIVEDNNDLRTFIKSLFASKYTVLEANNGENGYDIANEAIPDLIISDIMMPIMDGLELCSKLKSSIKTNHIPLLLLTAKTGETNTISGLNTGAVDYLSKPFSSALLLSKVESLLRLKNAIKEHFTNNFILNPIDFNNTVTNDLFLNKLINYIEHNISNPNLDVDDLLNEMSVSRTQLFRKVKALTNCSANQLIRNIRLKNAANLILQKSLSVSDILYQCGFNSPSYFTTCFKEMFGCLPKEYADQKTKKDNYTFIG